MTHPCPADIRITVANWLILYKLPLPVYPCNSILNIPPANCVAASHTDISAMTRSHDTQAQHYLLCGTSVVHWQHRSTTSELPFT
jgi:hypothetical protein